VIEREHKGVKRPVDVRALISEVDVIDGDAAAALCGALDWTPGALLRVRVSATADGSAKPAEVTRALGVGGLVARLGVVTQAGRGENRRDASGGGRSVARVPVIAGA
jgi:hypothetical protein